MRLKRTKVTVTVGKGAIVRDVIYDTETGEVYRVTAKDMRDMELADAVFEAHAPHRSR